MLNPFSRTELLGRDAMERLAASRVADIYKTRVDPPARVMRRELKKAGHPEIEGRLFQGAASSPY